MTWTPEKCFEHNTTVVFKSKIFIISAMVKSFGKCSTNRDQPPSIKKLILAGIPEEEEEGGVVLEEEEEEFEWPVVPPEELEIDNEVLLTNQVTSCSISSHDMRVNCHTCMLRCPLNLSRKHVGASYLYHLCSLIF